MRNLILISGSGTKEEASDFASELTEAGFSVDSIAYSKKNYQQSISVERLEESSAVVALVKEPDNRLFVDLAYLVGREKPVWILSNNASSLPSVLRRASFIQLSRKNSPSILVEEIKQKLEIEIPSNETIRDLSALMSWLREEPRRITGLSSWDFERMVTLLLTNLGLTYEMKIRQAEGDFVFFDSDRKTRLLVESKHYPAGRKIDVGAIRQSIANATKFECEFAVLVTANELTKAAREYASMSAPPCWLMDRPMLEILIGKDFGRSSQNMRGVLTKLIERDEDKSPIQKGGRTSDLRWEQLYTALKESQRVRKRFSWQHYAAPEGLEAFLSFAKSGTSGAAVDEQSYIFISDLIGAGVKVWHDLPSLAIGNLCLRLDEVATAARRSDLIVYFLDENVYQSLQNKKVLQTIALELTKSPISHNNIFVIGDSGLWNRLRLPRIFSESTFFSPSEVTWKTEILDLCRRIISETYLSSYSNESELVKDTKKS
jgi:hypothetical protein